jgi:glycosyltransferase involved in cell wall biosynthesis
MAAPIKRAIWCFPGKDIDWSYYWIPNGGMHSALNFGIRIAQGEYWMQLDDDDRLLPFALERFDREIQQLPAGHAFINALCRMPDGRVLGSSAAGRKAGHLSSPRCSRARRG